MTIFSNSAEIAGFKVKLWRGERMCLIAMNVAEPEDDFVGFSIEVRNPGSGEFVALRNRLAFSYDEAADKSVTGARQYASTEAPFQRFRWIHFPKDPTDGIYSYRVTKRHMPREGRVEAGASLTVDIPLDAVTYSGFLDIGFTRGFASSQAYAERFKNRSDIIPAKPARGLEFQKQDSAVYEWLGFEARDLIFGFLEEAAADPTISLDVLAYDLNEPDIVAALERLGDRLRIVIDDSGTHGRPKSAETGAARRLSASAGADHVRRMHFQSLQHNKVLIAKRAGEPFQVLHGSTNFSFRGLYIQANNVLVFRSPEAASLFGRAFDLAFADPKAFKADDISTRWRLVQPAGMPAVHFCFSPHRSTDLSLSPVGAAIDQATSSVLYSIAFLGQTKDGPTRDAIDRLMGKPVFSYGIVDKAGDLEVRKPDGSAGMVDFAYLAKTAPEPFSAEWSGGGGINVHHKFVVTDFSLTSAKVFTGSSNLSPSGERGNGDNLVMIEDPRVAAAYAIEALRMFDHLHFRSRMQDASKTAKPLASLTLKKPAALGGGAPWFAPFYEAGSQKENDRKLFAR